MLNALKQDEWCMILAQTRKYLIGVHIYKEHYDQHIYIYIYINMCVCVCVCEKFGSVLFHGTSTIIDY